jgi:hypothetical protein
MITPRSKFVLLIVVLAPFLMAACSQSQATNISVSTDEQEQVFADSFHGTIDNWNQSLLLEVMPRNIYDEPQITLENGKLISLNIKNVSQYSILLSEIFGLKILRFSNQDHQWKAVTNNLTLIEGANGRIILTPKGVINEIGMSERHLPIIPLVEETNVDSATIRVVVTGEVQDSNSKGEKVGAYIDLTLLIK